MQTPEALYRVAYECVEDLAARQRRLRRDPVRPRTAHRPRACRWTRSSTRCWPGFADGEKAASSEGRTITVRCLVTAMRHAARSLEIAELAIRFRDKGVVGFDIAGAEAGYPPTRHLDAFEYMRSHNARFTIHAGEAFGLPSIHEAIAFCGADRLGHGVRIVDDITVAPTMAPSTRPAGGAAAGQAGSVRAVPELQRADGCGRQHRRAPVRPVGAAAGSASRSTPTTG